MKMKVNPDEALLGFLFRKIYEKGSVKNGEELEKKNFTESSVQFNPEKLEAIVSSKK